MLFKFTVWHLWRNKRVGQIINKLIKDSPTHRPQFFYSSWMSRKSGLLNLMIIQYDTVWSEQDTLWHSKYKRQWKRVSGGLCHMEMLWACFTNMYHKYIHPSVIIIYYNNITSIYHWCEAFWNFAVQTSTSWCHPTLCLLMYLMTL